VFTQVNNSRQNKTTRGNNLRLKRPYRLISNKKSHTPEIKIFNNNIHLAFSKELFGEQ